MSEPVSDLRKILESGQIPGSSKRPAPEEPELPEKSSHGWSAVLLAFIIISVIFFSFLVRTIFELDFITGIKPRTLEGFPGIFTAPLIHGGINHLFSNLPPLAMAVAGIAYLYRPIRHQILSLTYLLPGIGVWLWNDPNTHIGASGWVYALLAFLFWSGILRRQPRPIALSLLIVFIYGSMVWGVFPMQEGVSWQSHLSGAVAGFFLAIIFRKVHVPDPFRDRTFEDDESEVFYDDD